jgi:hypothetical protein
MYDKNKLNISYEPIQEMKKRYKKSSQTKKQYPSASEMGEFVGI